MFVSLIFPYFISSTQFAKRFQRTEAVARLPSYGFKNGGYLSLVLYSTDLPHLNTFVIKKDKFPQGLTRKDLINDFCQRYFPFLNEYDQRSSSPLSTVHEFRINESGIYVPYVVNCGESAYSVQVSYINPSSFLDSRDQFIPYFYTSFSIIYVLLFICWIVNGLSYSRFLIPLHTYMAVSPIITALSLYQKGTYWNEISISNNIDDQYGFISFIFEIIAETYFYTINCLVLFGFGVYRTHIHMVEWLSLAIVIAIVLIAFTLCQESVEPYVWLPLSFVGIINGYIGYTIIKKRIDIALDVAENHSTQIVQDKVTFIIKFIKFFSTLILVKAGNSLYFWLMKIASQYSTSIAPDDSVRIDDVIISSEILKVFMYVADMFWFFYRKDYEPDLSSLNPDFDDLQNSEIITLKEPCDTSIALIKAEAAL